MSVRQRIRDYHFALAWNILGLLTGLVIEFFFDPSSLSQFTHEHGRIIGLVIWLFVSWFVGSFLFGLMALSFVGVSDLVQAIQSWWKTFCWLTPYLRRRAVPWYRTLSRRSRDRLDFLYKIERLDQTIDRPGLWQIDPGTWPIDMFNIQRYASSASTLVLADDERRRVDAVLERAERYRGEAQARRDAHYRKGSVPPAELPQTCPVPPAADQWATKGMCPNCGIWVYRYRETDAAEHCGLALIHVELHSSAAQELEKHKAAERERREAEQLTREIEKEDAARQTRWAAEDRSG